MTVSLQKVLPLCDSREFSHDNSEGESKLLVSNFLNLPLNPQLSSFRKGRSVSIAQVSSACAVARMWGAGRAPVSDRGKAASSNKQARIWGPS